MPKKKKKEKVLYDFDYEEEEELKDKKKNKKAEKKKSASKKHTKKRQASNTKKYDDEIIIGVTKFPEKEEKKKKENQSNNKKSKKVKKTKKKEKAHDIIKEPIYNYDFDEIYEKENKKPKNRKFKMIAKWSIGLVVFIGLICFLLLSPVFNVQKIQVIGNSKITNDEIISLAQINTDENIFKVINAIVENNIKQNPYVSEVQVSKKMPDTIEISIQERTPNFLLEFGNGYVYVNNQGYMLEISSQKLDVPIITGIVTSEEQYITGNRLESKDLEKLGTAIKIVDTAKNNGIENLITKIDISDETNYKIYLETEKKIAYLGDCSNLETRMLYLVAIINNEKNIEGEIFVNMNLNSENAFFRESV